MMALDAAFHHRLLFYSGDLFGAGCITFVIDYTSASNLLFELFSKWTVPLKWKCRNGKEYDKHKVKDHLNSGVFMAEN